MGFKNLDSEIDEVVIIDILPNNERKKWSITQDVCDFLTGIRIPNAWFECVNKSDVFEAFKQCEKRIETKRIMLQFTAHGNEQGIGFKQTDEFIEWTEFRPYLKKLNKLMGGNLLLNMVACKGIYGTDIQTLLESEDPFFGIIGPIKNIEVFQAKRLNKQFYQQMYEGVEVPKIVINLNQKENDTILWCISSQYKRIYNGQSLSM